MLTYSTEAAIFLALFDLVVVSLPLCALLWTRLREKRHVAALGYLVTGFSLLGASFTAAALSYRLALSSSDQAGTTQVLLAFVTGLTSASAGALLGAACLRLRGRRDWLRRFLIGAFALVLIGALRSSAELVGGPRSIDPVTTLRAAEVLILLAAVVLLGWPPSLHGIALFLIGLGRASGFLAALRPQLTAVAWSVGAVLELLGLLLLVFTIESVTESRVLHYVLRFNLVFVSLAVSLTIALAEIGRRQFVEFSAMQARDVAEFARSHLVYESVRGSPPELALARPVLTSGLVREFGRYPDLKRIELELSGRAMTLEILPTGEINREFGDQPPIQAPLVKPADFLEALLLKLPVVVEGRTAGQVALYHSVTRVNAHIGHQMLVAFGVFTLFVVVGSIVTGLLVLVADRTILRQDRELAEAQRRLLASERLASVGAVADALAHEINNPVGVLVARSDYLLSVIRDRPMLQEIREDLDTIRRQAQRVAKTVQDLLSSTRGARRTWAAVDIETVVDAAIKLVSPSLRDRRVRIEFRRPEQPLRVWGDQDRLEQVLVNLLTNAVQAIQDRGRVTVEAVARDSEWIELLVTDTGSGITPEHLPRIFDRFFTTKEAGFGSGLGLSIVSGIIRDHGGQIVVDSSVGKGSCFRVVLRSYVPTSEQAGTVAGEST